jgi:hypothetical protein
MNSVPNASLSSMPPCNWSKNPGTLKRPTALQNSREGLTAIHGANDQCRKLPQNETFDPGSFVS